MMAPDADSVHWDADGSTSARFRAHRRTPCCRRVRGFLRRGDSYGQISKEWNESTTTRDVDARRLSSSLVSVNYCAARARTLNKDHGHDNDTRPPQCALTTHVMSSVGWLGAVGAFLALAIAGVDSEDAQIVRAAYLAMHLTTWFVIVPLCLAALLTGIVQSLGTSPVR